MPSNDANGIANSANPDQICAYTVGFDLPVVKGSKVCRWYFCALHYANKPMQYTVNFHSCKNDTFQMENCDIFLIFAPNIDCGHTLEPHH